MHVKRAIPGGGKSKANPVSPTGIPFWKSGRQDRHIQPKFTNPRGSLIQGTRTPSAMRLFSKSPHKGNGNDRSARGYLRRTWRRPLRQARENKIDITIPLMARARVPPRLRDRTLRGALPKMPQ